MSSYTRYTSLKLSRLGGGSTSRRLITFSWRRCDSSATSRSMRLASTGLSKQLEIFLIATLSLRTVSRAELCVGGGAGVCVAE
jgi:hypothetical protein